MNTPSADYLPPELMTLLATAALEIDLHLADNGTCVVCSEIWPCTRARLADVALAAL